MNVVMSDVTVSTIAELIEKLGGPSKAGEILGASPQRAVNWRNSGKITAELFVQHQAALKARGLSAPPSFWGQSA